MDTVAVQDAQTLVQDMKQALTQAGQQMIHAEVQLQQTIPTQQARASVAGSGAAGDAACLLKPVIVSRT